MARIGLLLMARNTVGGTSRDMTITNTNNGTSRRLFASPALEAARWLANKTVKNANLVGSTVTATARTLAGVFSGKFFTISIASTGADNDANTIQNNNITKTQDGIYTGGAECSE